MPKVSVNILTKNRSRLLKRAIDSVLRQSFKDFEVVIIDDGSTDDTAEVLKTAASLENVTFIPYHNSQSLGITKSRQLALEFSKGEYIAILDDDDEWVDTGKLEKEVKFLDEHKDCVLVGGGIKISNSPPTGDHPKGDKYQIPNIKKDINTEELISKFRPETDARIRATMLLRNNFLTSTVVFRKEAALKAGGFIKDEVDLAEDYDLWLRMGVLGKMHNFQEVFTRYTQPDYNKDKLNRFLSKQLQLIEREKNNYSFYLLSKLILKLRLLF